MKTLLAALALAGCLCAQQANAPNYTAAGIVNGASFAPGLSPNTIVSIFGTNLSWDTVALQASDLAAGVMPTSLGNVEVYFEGWPAYLYYVSPTQINLLVPSSLIPGTFQFWVARQGTSGPIVSVTLQSAAPALFEYPAGTAIATHPDGSLVSSSSPAAGGGIVTLWATGLGNTDPSLEDGVLPAAAQWLSQLTQFEVQINGAALDPTAILYAGVAPGFAGLYQVNVQLPAQLPANPEIRLGLAGAMSPAGLILPAN
ncbi:MAG TPA: IPT/TIG domain-containing protein [Bryobacteraceae bacterium]|nr:IPT/TIG domain-containing protein [Bryobacteraceae bacterium]